MAHGGIRQHKLLHVKSFGISSSWYISSIGRMVLYIVAKTTEMIGVLPSFHITISTQVLALARGENSSPLFTSVLTCIYPEVIYKLPLKVSWPKLAACPQPNCLRSWVVFPCVQEGKKKLDMISSNDLCDTNIYNVPTSAKYWTRI